MAVNLSPVGGVAQQFFSDNGVPLSGGLLYTYAAGTTTPQPSYTSSNGSTAHTNPIVLNSAGRVPGGEIWITDGFTYKFVLKDSNDVLIATYDNISGINSNFIAFTNQQEIQTATAGQTVFTLTTMQYQAGTNSLSVFVDGVNQYGPGAQYAFVETSSTVVTFVTGLHVGASVKFTTSQQQGAGTIDASQVSYTPPFTGSVTTNVEAKLAETVNVIDFGADPTGVLDSTAAFNLATKSAYTSTGNSDQNFPGVVDVPAGLYKITGTVYVHKGQHLRGSGPGSKINATGMLGLTVPVFKLGHSATAEDAGALPPEISGLFTDGGPDVAVVESQVAGSFVHNIFFSGPGIALTLGGADTIITDIICDVGNNGFVITGQNHVIDSCLFFNQNYPIQISSNTNDVQINNCHFEYSKYDDILFLTAATNIQDIAIQNCQFVKNVQYATSDQAIQIRCVAASITIHGCEFRNQRGFSITTPTGTANILRVSNCVFNGTKTNTTYAQSSTAAGIKTENAYAEITNCTFINLYGNPIQVATSAAVVPTVIKNCTYRSITTATSFVTITATLGTLTITGCTGDDILPLINLQNIIVPRLKSNTRWLGAAATSSGYFYWKIPTTGGAMVNVGIMANALPSGNANYRDVSSIYAARSVDYNTSTLVAQDVANKYTIYETTSTSLIGPLNIAVQLDSVGGGSTSPYVNAGRYLVVYIPDTYQNVEIEADFVI